MSDKEESVDAILAEFRSFALRAAVEDHCKVNPEGILLLCDKVQIALARERNAHANDIHDALYRTTGVQGNVRAMRAALEKIREKCVIYNNDLAEQIDALCGNALAAPARNCDRFETAEEAMRAFDAMCDQTSYCRQDECEAGAFRRTKPGGGVGCVPGWLFATASEPPSAEKSAK